MHARAQYTVQLIEIRTLIVFHLELSSTPMHKLGMCTVLLGTHSHTTVTHMASQLSRSLQKLTATPRNMDRSKQLAVPIVRFHVRESYRSSGNACARSRCAAVHVSRASRKPPACLPPRLVDSSSLPPKKRSATASAPPWHRRQIPETHTGKTRQIGRSIDRDGTDWRLVALVCVVPLVRAGLRSTSKSPCLWRHPRCCLPARSVDWMILFRCLRAGTIASYKITINIFLKDKGRKRKVAGYRYIASCSTDSKTYCVYDRWDQILIV
jgi:hypothetical protein